MNIIGPDKLIFAVDDVTACKQFALDYGLTQQDDVNFVALDGTGIEIHSKDNASLPQALSTGSMLRKTLYGVADQKTVDAIKAELAKDREVKTLDDGSIEAMDDMGFVLGFQVTIRQTLYLPAETINAPGAPPQRGVNKIGVSKEFVAKPRSLSHVVYFVPDAVKAEAFFAERLGFVTTDRFKHMGPFMRPAGTNDHHTLFFLNTPPQMQGVEHFTFHMSGPTEVAQAGNALVEKGYQSLGTRSSHLWL